METKPDYEIDQRDGVRRLPIAVSPHKRVLMYSGTATLNTLKGRIAT